MHCTNKELCLDLSVRETIWEDSWNYGQHPIPVRNPTLVWYTLWFRSKVLPGSNDFL